MHAIPQDVENVNVLPAGLAVRARLLGVTWPAVATLVLNLVIALGAVALIGLG